MKTYFLLSLAKMVKFKFKFFIQNIDVSGTLDGHKLMRLNLPLIYPSGINFQGLSNITNYQ